jgi:hypothetical protein
MLADSLDYHFAARSKAGFPRRAHMPLIPLCHSLPHATGIRKPIVNDCVAVIIASL